MIDTHLHLDLLDDGLPGHAPLGADASLQQAAQAGVTDVVAIGVDPRVSSSARAPLAAPVRVHHALGFHPQALATSPDDDANERDLDDALRVLHERLLRRGTDVVALGETGLDARAGMPSRALQERAFVAQLELARRHDLPVVLHGVRRDGDMLRLLDEHGAARGALRGVWHGYSGAVDTMRAVVKRGLFVSVGFIVLHENARRLREAVPHIPLAHLVVETDAPPLPPARLRDVVAEVAKLRGATADELAAVTADNARRLFGLAAAH